MNLGMRTVLLRRCRKSSDCLMLALVFLMASTLVTSRRLTPEENAELKSKCGQRSLLKVPQYKSVGGWRARSLEFPYIVGFTYGNGFCSGVQISKRHILTAAHCVVNNIGGGKWALKPAKDFTVYVGNKCGHPLLCLQGRAYKTLGNPMPYEGYNGRNGDIAIIELNRDISKSDGAPVCMPERKKSLGTQLTAVGYGVNPKETRPFRGKPFHWLQAVQLKFSHIDEKGREIVTKNRDKSVCGGDSGGPLIQLNKESKDVVVGITVRHITCEGGSSDWSSIFTDVRKKLDWICDRTGVCPTDEWRTLRTNF